MESILQDIRLSARRLWRTPGANVSFVVVMALGIGSTTAVLSVVDGVLVRPFHATHPERVVRVGVPLPSHMRDPLTWWSQGESFDHIAQYWSGGTNLAGGVHTERIHVAVVSPDFFSVFGVKPQAGRPFVTDDDTPGRNRVAVLSDSLWRRNFGGDPNVVGQKINLNDIPHTIVGIMVPRFSYPGRTEIWVARSVGDPNAFFELGSSEFSSAFPLLENAVIGRLRAGVDVTRARLDLNTLFLRLKLVYPEFASQFGEGISIQPLREMLIRDLKPALLMLLGGAILLLMISCANSASILMAQAVVRQKEVAVRLSLGAGRMRILRQFLTESVLLTSAGGAIGVLVAYWGLKAILVIAPKQVVHHFVIQLDYRALLVSLMVSLMVGMVVGLAPACQALSPSLARTLKEEGFGSGRRLGGRARVALVTGQVSLTLALLAGAGLTAQSTFRLLAMDPGFDAKNGLAMSIALSKTKYLGSNSERAATNQDGQQVEQKRRTPSPARLFQVYRQLLEEVASVPAVVSVGAANELPLSGTRGGKVWFGIGGTLTNSTARVTNVAGDYFHSMGIRLVRGRPFSPMDTDDSPKVVIVNESFARKYLGGIDQIGQKITFLTWDGPWREIVGVARDVRDIGLGEPAQPQIYLPALQPREGGNGLPPLDFALVVRTTGDPRAVIGPVRERVRAVDRDLPVFGVRTLEEVVAESASPYRFRGALLGSFGLSALLLALLGVYGLVSYTVACRTHEIGVRMVFGAQQSDILSLILRQAASLAVVGVIIGVALVLIVGRLVASLLFELKYYDPLTTGVSCLVIVVGVIAASIIPALRASRLEPARLIRYE